MADETIKKSGVPSMPVEDILVNVAESVVRAQQALDNASLNSELRIREQELDKLGLSAQWYTIPELNFDLRLAFEIGDRGEVTTQMVDAEYQSKYGFDVKASSLLQTKIVAVPPGEAAGLSLLDKAFVLKLAGRIKLVVEAYARAGAPYFTVQYRPFVTQGYDGGLWYVMLLDTLLSGKRKLMALVVVDDAEGKVVRIWTDTEEQPVTVKGVAFKPVEAMRTIKLVNAAEPGVLMDEVGLTSTVSGAIAAARPFASLEQLAAVEGLGPKSLEKLRDYVMRPNEGG